jgi:hypothetical protein
MPFEFLVPIVLFIVSGAVAITTLYFRSREREMLLSKDFTAEELNLILHPDPKRKGGMVVIGILIISFGLGMGSGFIISDLIGKKDFVPIPMFVFLGIGLVISYYVREKLNKNDGE